jgi:ABC-type lipoprotein release transport system permease subunit
VLKIIILVLLGLVFGPVALGLAVLAIVSIPIALAVLVAQVLPIRHVPRGYNWRNLTLRWITTGLTALGFMLVVALLVVMLAFVQGLNALAKKTGPEGNVILLRDGATDELFSDMLVADAQDVLARYSGHPLVRQHLEFDGEQPVVSMEIYSIATQEIPPSSPDGKPTYRFLQVRGVEDAEMSGKVHGLSLQPGGKWFSRAGNEVVMGAGIARTLGMNVGDLFNPRPELKWTVAGILDSKGSPFDSEIWAKREEVGRYFGKDNEERKQSFYSSVVLTTKNQATAEEVASFLRQQTEGVRVNAMTERKYYEEMSKSNQTFLVAAIFIAVIMAIGGMFGLMNTMFAAVSHRIKDIGILRILGYSRGQVLVSFLLESLLLALVGGGLGILLGYLCNGLEQTSFVNSGQGGGKTVVFSMVVDQYVLAAATLFTVIMGVSGGLLPSLLAMRSKPLEAVR